MKHIHAVAVLLLGTPVWGLPPVGYRTLKTDQPARSVAFSPDGATLAAACDDGSIYIWHHTDRPERFRLRSPAGSTGAISYLHSRRLVSAEYNGALRVWDVATGKAVKSLAGKQLVLHLAASADGRFVATGSWGGTVFVWDIAQGKVVHQIPSPEWGFPDGPGKVPPCGMIPGPGIRSLAWCRDDRALAVARDNGEVFVWRRPTGKQTRLLPKNGQHSAVVAVSPDGRTLAVVGFDIDFGGDLHYQRLTWETISGKTRARLEPCAGHVSWLAFSPDGRWLVGDAWPPSSRVSWDLVSGRQRVLATGETESVMRVAFSPDGRTLAIVNYDGVVKLRDASKLLPN